MRCLGAPLLLACLATACPVSAQDALPLWSAKGTPCQKTEPAVATLACLAVDVDAKRLARDTKQLSLVLPGGKDLLVTLRKATPALRGFVWDGQGHEVARATFSVVDDFIVGDIQLRDSRHIYRLRYTPAREYVVEEIDPAKIKTLPEPPQYRREPPPRPLRPASVPMSGPVTAAPPAPPPPPPPPASAVPTERPPARPDAVASAPSECRDDPRSIDVMVVYTPAVRISSVTAAQVLARVNQAVQDTNTAFTDSNVDTQLRLVHTAEVAFTGDQDSLVTTLDTLTDPAGVLSQVHQLRDQFKADVVMLIVDIPGTAGGLARPYGGRDYAFEAFAVITEFSLTRTTGYFFAHELGHVMGSEHDTASRGVFPYSRGMRTSQGSRTCPDWGTIMAQPVCAQCEPLLLWSNPNLPARCGQAPGVVDERDNARSLNQTREIVANFRCSGSP